jgi:hypothetical protein
LEDIKMTKHVTLKLVVAYFAIAAPTTVFAQQIRDVIVETQPLIDSEEFDRTQAEEQLRRRLESDVYAGYTVDLGIDDPKRCEDAAFAPYKTEGDCDSPPLSDSGGDRIMVPDGGLNDERFGRGRVAASATV